MLNLKPKIRREDGSYGLHIGNRRIGQVFRPDVWGAVSIYGHFADGFKLRRDAIAWVVEIHEKQGDK